MNSITLNAPGKINLGLDVTGIREDGYHMVRMVMQTVELSDSITVTKTSDDNITMECNRAGLPTDDSNLCIKAAHIMNEHFNLKQGYHIALTKNIPVAAGMAGGSTDAATVMLAIDKLMELNASQNTLLELALPIGADVPYCIMRGTALAEGIGEELTPLPHAPQCHVLIAKPPIDVSTGAVYKALDSADVTIHPDIDGIVDAIKADDLYKMASLMGNVLQDVTIPMHSEVAVLKSIMMDYGAINSMMSGSGPTVFGLFDNEAQMQKCIEHIRNANLTESLYGTRMCY